MALVHPRRIVWIVIDGAAAWIVRRLLQEATLPAFAQLRERGCYADTRPPMPNSHTPPSLATLFTGRGPEEHGIDGYWLRDGSGRRSGFSDEALRSEPIWLDALA